MIRASWPRLDQPPCQPLGSRAGFHADQCLGGCSKVGQQRVSAELGALDYGATCIQGNDVKTVLANIDAVGRCPTG